MIHLDTHVVAWLFQGERARLRPVEHRLQGASPLISPMVWLELQYLYEIGRVRVGAADIIAHLTSCAALRLSTHPFIEVVRIAEALRWTRDPFDRLIAAQAIAEGATLLTSDENILGNCPGAAWS